jgi:hypothetical protein
MIRRRSANSCAASVVAMSLFLSFATNNSIVRADDRYYVGLPGGGTGNWNNPLNWSATAGGTGGAGVPGANDSAFIQDSDALNRNVLLDVSPTIAVLSIGNNGGGMSTLVQNIGFDLTAPYENIGDASGPSSARGAYIQNGGTNAVTQLSVGAYTSETFNNGTYTLNGGILNVQPLAGAGTTSNPELVVGRSQANGTFEQNGGTINVVGFLIVGETRDATGFFRLTSGSLNVTGEEDVGYDGPGTFIQSGGTHIITASNSLGLALGEFSGSAGSYFLSGNDSTLIVNGEESIGARGAGTFVQSGGSHLITGSLLIGNAGIGGGTLQLSGGSLSVASGMIVGGVIGFGHVVQTGGAVAVGTGSGSANADLVLGNTSSFGGYTLSDSAGPATLAVYGNEVLGAPTVSGGGGGHITQTGGLHTVTGSIVIDRGLFSLDGGTLNVGGSELLGQNGSGEFVQTGGLNTAVGLTLANLNGSTGTFTLSGGTLRVTGGEMVGDNGTATFAQTGGVHTIGLSGDLNGNITLGHSSGGGAGTYLLSGASASLAINGYETIGFHGPGTFIQSAGNNSVTGALYVGISAAPGYLALNGGTISAPQIWVRSGTFLYSGGAVNVGWLRLSDTMTVAQGSHLTAVVGSLTIDNVSAKVDLTDNNMVVDYTSAPGTLVDDTRHDLHDGALFSSVTAIGGHSTRLGYGDNALLHKGTFGGKPVDVSSLLIKYTYGGDANLDGKVDVTDLGAMATDWQSSGVWTDGDFNYDGFVDVSDLGILATNWQAGVGSPLGPGSLDAAMAAVGLSGVSVPEPSAGLASLLIIGLMRRWRRGRRLVTIH